MKSHYICCRTRRFKK